MKPPGHLPRLLPVSHSVWGCETAARCMSLGSAATQVDLHHTEISSLRTRPTADLTFALAAPKRMTSSVQIEHYRQSNALAHKSAMRHAALRYCDNCFWPATNSPAPPDSAFLRQKRERLLPWSGMHGTRLGVLGKLCALSALLCLESAFTVMAVSVRRAICWAVLRNSPFTHTHDVRAMLGLSDLTPLIPPS